VASRPVISVVRPEIELFAAGRQSITAFCGVDSIQWETAANVFRSVSASVAGSKPVRVHHWGPERLEKHDGGVGPLISPVITFRIELEEWARVVDFRDLRGKVGLRTVYLQRAFWR